MSDLDIVLAEFETYALKNKLPIVSKLNPGIEINTSDLLAMPKGIVDTIVPIYRWKNGTNVLPTDNLGKLWLFDFGMFIPVSKALNLYHQGAGNIEKWDKNKFPLFISGGGEFYLIECNDSDKNFGSIYFHSIGDFRFEYIIKKFDSLVSLFKSTIQCFEEGAYFYNENNEIKFNFTLESQISRRLNSNSGFWELPHD
jgi:hypothetical protein